MSLTRLTVLFVPPVPTLCTWTCRERPLYPLPGLVLPVLGEASDMKLSVQQADHVLDVTLHTVEDGSRDEDQHFLFVTLVYVSHHYQLPTTCDC